ncbi:hypothetical protein ACVBEH_07810 [Roseateles sp. GG27B]
MKLSTIKPVLTAAILAASLGALPAHAENLYVGAALGVPHFGAGANGINGVTGQGSGVSSKLYGGYQVTPNFALEAGVADLGHINNGVGSVSSQGTFLDAVGLRPLNNKWSLLGSLGVAHVNEHQQRRRQRQRGQSGLGRAIRTDQQRGDAQRVGKLPPQRLWGQAKD